MSSLSLCVGYWPFCNFSLSSILIYIYIYIYIYASSWSLHFDSHFQTSSWSLHFDSHFPNLSTFQCFLLKHLVRMRGGFNNARMIKVNMVQ